MQKYAHTLKNCTLNTGTIFDLATGDFRPGKNGQQILNGGLFLTNAVTGRPQTYKTSTSMGYFTRALRNYNESKGLCYETEMSLQGVDRVVALSGNPNDDDLRSRFEYYDNTELALEDLFDVIKSIAKDKDKNKKDLVRETPFIDKDGKYIKSWVPTIIGIDSWSAASSLKELSLYDEHQIGDSKTNMVAMNDGRIKSVFARQLPYICGARGIYIVSTAHIGNNIKLDPYSAPTKDLPMMRANDKLKSVGTQYSFLAMNMVETRKVEPLLDSKKKCLYPSENCTSDVELQKITSFITRCKNNISGSSFDHISSQFTGIQEYLEYYMLIVDSKSALIEGRDNQKLGITDHEFNRLSIRKLIASDYTFCRALEILGQFVFVRNRWNIPIIKNMGYVEFCKKFNASASLKEEMLNSTGIWDFIGSKGKRPYMSIMDIVNKINAVK